MKDVKKNDKIFTNDATFLRVIHREEMIERFKEFGFEDKWKSLKETLDKIDSLSTGKTKNNLNEALSVIRYFRSYITVIDYITNVINDFDKDNEFIVSLDDVHLGGENKKTFFRRDIRTNTTPLKEKFGKAYSAALNKAMKYLTNFDLREIVGTESDTMYKLNCGLAAEFQKKKKGDKCNKGNILVVNLVDFFSIKTESQYLSVSNSMKNEKKNSELYAVGSLNLNSSGFGTITKKARKDDL